MQVPTQGLDIAPMGIRMISQCTFLTAETSVSWRLIAAIQTKGSLLIQERKAIGSIHESLSTWPAVRWS